MAGGIKGNFNKSKLKVKSQTGKISSPKSPSTRSLKSSSKIGTASSLAKPKKSSSLALVSGYNRRDVKRLNERFRKIQTVPKYKGSSYYKALKESLISHPNSARSKAYVVSTDLETGKMKIRMLNATEYAAADEKTRQAFREELSRGLNAQTTTYKGMRSAYNKAAETLKQNETYRENLKDVSNDQITAAWQMYGEVQNWLKSENQDFDDTRGYDIMTNYLAQYKGIEEDTNFDELFDRLAGSSNKLREEFDAYNNLERGNKNGKRQNNQKSGRRRG